MAALFSERIALIARDFDQKEKRQDAVLSLSREIVRDCAKAIKHIHTGDWTAANAVIDPLTTRIRDVKAESAVDFEHISSTALQEYAEVKCLAAILQRQPIPTDEQLGIDSLSWLNGLADCTGELRRATQLALRAGKTEEAEYCFAQMNAIYDELMTLKYASSLMGGLRRKQDVLRSQLEMARSEMLRASS